MRSLKTHNANVVAIGAGLALLSFVVGIVLLLVPDYYRKQITRDLVCERAEANHSTIMCELEEAGRLSRGLETLDQFELQGAEVEHSCLGIALGGFCARTLLLTDQGVIAIGIAAEPTLIDQINNYVKNPEDTNLEALGLQIRSGKLTYHEERSAGLPMIVPVICLLPLLLILAVIAVKNRRKIIAGFIVRD